MPNHKENLKSELLYLKQHKSSKDVSTFEEELIQTTFFYCSPDNKRLQDDNQNHAHPDSKINIFETYIVILKTLIFKKIM